MGGGGGRRNRRLEDLQAQALADEQRERQRLEDELEQRRLLRLAGGRSRQLRFLGPGPIARGRPAVAPTSLTSPAAERVAISPTRSTIVAGRGGRGSGDAGSAGGRIGGSGVGPGSGDAGSGGGGSSPDVGSACFVAGTKIMMRGAAAKPIEDVQLGDHVMAFEGDGPLSPRRVIGQQVHTDRPLIRLNEVVCTAEHLIYARPRWFAEQGREGFDWQPAGELQRGDMMMDADGQPVEITAVGEAGVATVFNIEVADLHTYVASGLRVHNNKAA